MRRVLRVAALLLLLPSVLSSQTAIALAEPAYATAPPAMNTTKLPPGFIGQNPWEIYESLAAVGGPRSEFETTEAYQKRIVAAPRAMIAATADLWNGDASLNYDADESMMDVHLLMERVGGSWGKWPQAVALATELTGRGTYAGNDVYGASGVVGATHYKRVQLALSSKRGLPYSSRGMEKLQFLVEMTPAQAQLAKTEKQLGVLVFFVPVAPLAGSYEERTGPTPQSLSVKHTKQRYIYGQIKAVWFYNKTDGTIYGKWQPKK